MEKINEDVIKFILNDLKKTNEAFTKISYMIGLLNDRITALENGPKKPPIPDLPTIKKADLERRMVEKADDLEKRFGKTECKANHIHSLSCYKKRMDFGEKMDYLSKKNCNSKWSNKKVDKIPIDICPNCVQTFNKDTKKIEIIYCPNHEEVPQMDTVPLKDVQNNGEKIKDKLKLEDKRDWKLKNGIKPEHNDDHKIVCRKDHEHDKYCHLERTNYRKSDEVDELILYE